MFAKITSTLFWLAIGVLCIFMYGVAVLIWLATVLFDRRLYVLHKFTCFWASFFTWPNPHWSVSFEGLENVDRKAAFVIVSNHLSMVDIPAAFRSFLHFKWVSKIENFKIPFVGWNMRMNRYIQLTRGSNKSNAKMIADCEKTLAEGSSVFIFPEGTRSNNGCVGTFRRGAFELAKRSGRPILPVVIDGSAEALPKKGVVVKGLHRIKFKFLDPILPESFANEDAEALTKRVEELIRAEHETLLAARLAKTGAAS